MTPDLRLRVGCELPAWPLFWLFETGSARDLSAGYTFTVLLEQDGAELLEVAGTVTANPNPTRDTRSDDDVPTLVFLPDAGALDDVLPGDATVHVVAVDGDGLDLPGSWSAVFARALTP